MSADAQIVSVRVQVVDMKPFTLDLKLPTYLPARDLTQRIARDAGLEAYWEDGRRRLYWLRARGRLVDDGETLADLQVVNGELVYLLPEPPSGGGVLERPPAYPENRGYQAKGTVLLLSNLLGTMVWTVAWGVALAEARNNWTVSLPAIALGLFTTSFARHAWSGRASRFRVAFTSLAVMVPCVVLALALAAFVSGDPVSDVLRQGFSSLVFGMIGVMFGWLAWWGAVEPLPSRKVTEEQAADESVAVVDCGLCGQVVQPDVRAECVYRCGRFFHTGCLRARTSVYTGDDDTCAVCGVTVG